MKTIASIVVPAFNEEENISAFVASLVLVLQEVDVDYEILFVDDGSQDGTLDVIKKEMKKNGKLRVLQFARNFGKEAAITCGLENAAGDVVIIMDSDLQHPPSVIPYMLDKWKEGFDMVVPLNLERSSEGLFYKKGSAFFYKLIGALSQVDLPVGGSDFRLIARPVVDVINSLSERNRFMKAIYAFPGFNVHTFPYKVQARHRGQSKWNYWKLWNFALDGLFGFSSMPLKIWMYVGFAISLLSILNGLYIGLDALINGIKVVKGVTTLAVFLFFLMGLMMISLGILGEYVARIYDEVKRRPIYVVQEKKGFEE